MKTRGDNSSQSMNQGSRVRKNSRNSVSPGPEREKVGMKKVTSSKYTKWNTNTDSSTKEDDQNDPIVVICIFEYGVIFLGGSVWKLNVE